MPLAGQWDDWVRSPRHVLALAVLIGSVLFYMLASQRLGFVLTSVLILTALILRAAASARRCDRADRGDRDAGDPFRVLQAAARAAALGRPAADRLVSGTIAPARLR